MKLITHELQSKCRYFHSLLFEERKELFNRYIAIKNEQENITLERDDEILKFDDCIVI